MFQELKFQLSTAILTILTLAAAVSAVINFQQQHRFRLADDGAVWVDRSHRVEALHLEANGPAANSSQTARRVGSPNASRPSSVTAPISTSQSAPSIGTTTSGENFDA